LSRKGQVLTIARRAEAIAGSWAQVSFAILPLIRSIENAIQAIVTKAELHLRRTSRSKVAVEDIQSSSHDGSYGGHPFSGTPAMSGAMLVTNTSRISYHVGLIYEAQQRDWLIDKLGLRNKDLIVTAYEVIPLSFMLDRIINVKKALSSLINLVDPTVDVLGGFVVKRETQTHTVQMTEWSIDAANKSVSSFAPLPHIEETFSMTREEWLPNISTALPIFNPKELISTAHKSADLAALLVLTISPLIRKYFVYR
jgi:hypothetical protein